MRNARLWRALLGVEKTVVEAVEFDEDEEVLVARVRPTAGASRRCGVCRRRCGRYDRGRAGAAGGRWIWARCRPWLEADAPRVACPEHGVVVASAVGAARRRAHLAFDDTVAWLAMAVFQDRGDRADADRLAHRRGDHRPGVGGHRAADDRFAGLRRIGIDEISYKRGHKYLTVVVDHDSGRLVWAAPGRDTATLQAFFDLLGPAAVRRRSRTCPPTAPTGSPTWWPALPERGALRRSVPRRAVGHRRARRGAPPGLERRPGAGPSDRNADAAARQPTPRHARPPNGPGDQGRPLRAVEEPGEPHRATSAPSWPGSPRPTPACTAPTCSKRACGSCSRSKDQAGKEALDRWISWARRCRIPAFVEPADAASSSTAPRSGRARPRPVQRPHRIDQHQDPAPHPHRVRVQIPRRPHRPGHAQPRRPPTSPAPAAMTHGNSRRAKFNSPGSPGEFHPEAPTEPCVTISRYTALLI